MDTGSTLKMGNRTAPLTTKQFHTQP